MLGSSSSSITAFNSAPLLIDATLFFKDFGSWGAAALLFELRSLAVRYRWFFFVVFDNFWEDFSVSSLETAASETYEITFPSLRLLLVFRLSLYYVLAPLLIKLTTFFKLAVFELVWFFLALRLLLS